MMTFAQYIFSLYFPEEAHDFTDNEHFFEFRDAQILNSGIPVEKLDAPYVPTTSTKLVTKEVTSPTINKRAHNFLKEKLKGTTEVRDIQRLLLNEIYDCSQQLGSIDDEELVEGWKLRIRPLLEQKTPLQRYQVLSSLLIKINTLSGKGSITMEKYLRSTKKDSSMTEFEEDEDDSSFKIPGK